MSETAKTTGTRIPRTIVLAAPVGAYLGITGPFGRDWSAAETGLVAGGGALVVLFAVPICQGLGKASTAAKARARAKAAVLKAKADAAAAKAKEM
ncbi:hypothetical protein ACFXPW_25555 [Streptomyces goshikiensis]|uniref:hypothetical protein n=1 Tax=Streptomyces goshikiensis TaxID=1942 RepID=UPI0036B70146